MRLGLFADGALAAEGYHRKLLEDREDILRRLRELLGNRIPYETRVLPNDYATFKREGWIKQ